MWECQFNVLNDMKTDPFTSLLLTLLLGCEVMASFTLYNTADDSLVFHIH